MGIYIDMEMPKSLGKNVTIYPDGRVVDYESGKKDIVGNAIEVPEGHGRLIDAGELEKKFIEAQKAYDAHGRDFADAFMSNGEICAEWWTVEDMLDNSPTVIPSDKEET